MSSSGPYDHSIQNLETSQVHESDKDKDYEIEVIDAVHDTRVSTETERRKKRLIQPPTEEE
ncbi:hypothetical protein D3C85_1649280 [compost metagenome]